jgi:hypothetical protein
LNGVRLPPAGSNPSAKSHTDNLRTTLLTGSQDQRFHRDRISLPWVDLHHLSALAGDPIATPNERAHGDEVARRVYRGHDVGVITHHQQRFQQGSSLTWANSVSAVRMYFIFGKPQSEPCNSPVQRPCDTEPILRLYRIADKYLMSHSAVSLEETVRHKPPVVQTPPKIGGCVARKSSPGGGLLRVLFAPSGHILSCQMSERQAISRGRCSNAARWRLQSKIVANGGRFQLAISVNGPTLCGQQLLVQ